MFIQTIYNVIEDAKMRRNRSTEGASNIDIETYQDQTREIEWFGFGSYDKAFGQYYVQ